MICKFCNIATGVLYPGGKCQKCLIGDKHPTQWLFETIKQSIISNTNQTSTVNVYESLCYRNGLYSAENPVSQKQINDTVVVGVQVCWNLRSGCGRITFKRWTQGGFAYYNDYGPIEIDNIEKLFEQGVPHFIEALRELILASKTKTYICANCNKVILTNQTAGQHFAGVYCLECWPKYKLKNSRKCLKCNKNEFECYC
jgi:hypothetical protein